MPAIKSPSPRAKRPATVRRVEDQSIDELFPFLKQANKNIRAAVRDLQKKGILDRNGQLIPPKELPKDMQEGSGQEC